jgi:8-oxo-dGTP pyrophosphatase MutT (NUDIX family)
MNEYLPFMEIAKKTFDMLSFTVSHSSNAFTCPRKSPDVNCRDFASAIKNGETVRGTVVGSWLKTETGFIQLKYCTPVSESKFEATCFVQHPSGGLHFRANPVDTREFIGARLPNGTPMRCLRELQPMHGIVWALMETANGQTGWVKAANCVGGALPNFAALTISRTPAAAPQPRAPAATPQLASAPAHPPRAPAAAPQPRAPAATPQLASAPAHPLHVPAPMPTQSAPAISRGPAQRMVLLQLRGKNGFFPDVLGLPGGCHDAKDRSSQECAVREMREETSFQLKSTTYVDCGAKCDYYMSTDPATFDASRIKDAHETQRIQGTWFEQYVLSLGGRIATHGHAWIPVDKLQSIPDDRFMIGIKGRIIQGLAVLNGGRAKQAPTATKNGFVILFNDM